MAKDTQFRTDEFAQRSGQEANRYTAEAGQQIGQGIEKGAENFAAGQRWKAQFVQSQRAQMFEQQMKQEQFQLENTKVNSQLATEEVQRNEINARVAMLQSHITTESLAEDLAQKRANTRMMTAHADAFEAQAKKTGEEDPDWKEYLTLLMKNGGVIETGHGPTGLQRVLKDHSIVDLTTEESGKYWETQRQMASRRHASGNFNAEERAAFEHDRMASLKNADFYGMQAKAAEAAAEHESAKGVQADQDLVQEHRDRAEELWKKAHEAATNYPGSPFGKDADTKAPFDLNFDSLFDPKTGEPRNHRLDRFLADKDPASKVQRERVKLVRAKMEEVMKAFKAAKQTPTSADIDKLRKIADDILNAPQ